MIVHISLFWKRTLLYCWRNPWNKSHHHSRVPPLHILAHFLCGPGRKSSCSHSFCTFQNSLYRPQTQAQYSHPILFLQIYVTMQPNVEKSNFCLLFKNEGKHAVCSQNVIRCTKNHNLWLYCYLDYAQGSVSWNIYYYATVTVHLALI